MKEIKKINSFSKKKKLQYFHLSNYSKKERKLNQAN